jgi:hypothetical protein
MYLFRVEDCESRITTIGPTADTLRLNAVLRSKIQIQTAIEKLNHPVFGS